MEKLKKYKTALFFFCDIILIVLAVYSSFLLRFDGQIPAYRLNHFWFTIVIALITTLPTFYFLGVYRLSWTYISLNDFPIILKSIILSTLFLGAPLFLFARDLPVLEGYPRSIFFLYPIILFLFVGILRFAKRIYWQLLKGQLPSEKKWRSLIEGAKPKETSINTVLVTGGAGYVGSVLVRKLLDKKYRVKMIDKLLFGDESIRELYKNPNFQFIQGDIQKIGDLQRAIEDVEAVIHLAAIVGDPACAADQETAIRTNYLATINLARLCKEAGIRKFIFASSCSTYGTGKNDSLIESSILNPVSLYAESKIYAEKELINMTDENFMPIIFRFSTVYGLSPRMRFDLVVNLLTMKAFIDRKILIFGGNQWRPFIHVSDVVQALICCLETPFVQITGQIFNIGANQENYLISDIGKIIKKIMPKTIVKIVAGNADQRTYNVSFDKVKKVFGFMPIKTVENGIKEIHQALEAGVFANPEDPKYYNWQRKDK